MDEPIRQEQERNWRLSGRGHELSIDARVQDGLDLVTLDGELDGTSHHELRQLFRDPAALNQTRVLLDLSGVRFIDSSGLGALLVAQESTSARGAVLRLVVDDPHILKLLALTRIDDRVGVHVSRHEASAAFDAG